MNSYAKLCIFIICSNNLIKHGLAECPPGWVSFAQKCFHLNPAVANFQGNQRYCNSLNASMVSIHSHAENNFVIGLSPTGWLGASTFGPSITNFEWIDRSNANYSNFIDEQPHIACIGKCCGLFIDNGLWASHYCHVQLPQLCQMPAFAVTRPAQPSHECADIKNEISKLRQDVAELKSLILSQGDNRCRS